MPSRPIPAVPKESAESGRLLFDTAVKESIEMLTGRRGAKIAPLKPGATTDQIAAKINEIIQHLQG